MGVGFLVAILSLFSFKKKSDDAAQLSVTPTTVSFPAEGGTSDITLKNGTQWSISNPAYSWLQSKKTSGNNGGSAINLSTFRQNETGAARSGILIFNSIAQVKRVTISQSANIYKSYHTTPRAPEATGMSNNAKQLAAKIKLGWNIGNTFEAPGSETGWGSPVITEDYIKFVKKRVKEVVQYCVNDGMYVLHNIHWDGGWLDCKATGAKLDTVKAIQKALWEQIATQMRDFDEKVMFASANEPDANDLISSSNLYAYHQIFINAVRATGGKNVYRTLVLQAPNTSLDLANYFAPGGLPGLPKDPVPDKSILEFHYYAPPNFCLIDADASWGKEWRYWGANFKSLTDPERNSNPSYEEAYVERSMQWAKKSLVDKNIPVLIGEFSVTNHAKKLAGNPADSLLSLASTAHFYGEILRDARANGIPAFLWDGVINRQTGTIGDRRPLDSLRKAAGY